MMKLKKPVIAAAGLALGIGLADQIREIRVMLLILVTLFVFAASLRYGDRKTLKIFLAFVICGFSIYAFKLNTKAAPLPDSYLDQNLQVGGQVTGFPYKDEEGRWRFQLEKFVIFNGESEKSHKGKLDVYLDSDPASLVLPGSWVVLEGKALGTSLRYNFGDPNWEAIQKRKDITARFFAQGMRIVKEPSKFNFLSLIWQMRRHLFTSLYALDNQGMPRLNNQTASLLISLSLGIADDLPQEWTDNFQRAGLLHLLAVSGGNVAFFLVGLQFFLGFLPLSRKQEYIILASFILFFMFLTALEPSVVRAGIMALSLLSAKILLRKTHWPSILSLMILLILPVWPDLLFETGFLLSFAAVWGLFVFTSPIFSFLNEKIRLPKSLALPLAATLGAQGAVLPLSLYYFQELSLIAPFSNLVFALLIIPSMPILILLWLVAPLGPFFGWIYGLAQLYCSLLLRVGGFFAKMPMASMNLPKLPLELVFISYFFFVTLVISCKTPIRRQAQIGSASFLLFLLLLWWHPWPYSLEVHVLDVGQGDCIFLRLPNGKTALIDGGGSGTGYSEVGKNTVLPYLRRLGINKIDLMILSHGHSDHYQGLIQVAEKMPYGIFAQGTKDISILPEDLSEWIKAQKASKNILLCEGDDIILDKRVKITVKQAQLTKDGNNNDSLVLHIVFKGTDLYLAGDLESEGELALLPKIEAIKSDTLLKVSHHGSAYSSISEFLAKITPEKAVISVSATNKYGHPSEQVLLRLKNVGSEVFTTATKGGIICFSDGKFWRVKTCLP